MFQSFADRGHYRAEGGSRQGIYVVTPAGELLAAANELDAGRLATLLEGALEDWRALPVDAREASADLDAARRSRWEDSCPEDGLVLAIHLRDVPRDFEPGAEPLQPSNRDFAWFSREEAAGLVGESELGAQPFVRRLARFHLVDAVRGQSLPFAEEELRRVSMSVRHLVDTGDTIELELEGETLAVAQGPWLMGPSDWTPDREYPRRVETEFRGRARWSRTAARFEEFELVAVGTREGFTRFNGRARQPEESPIGFSLRLAPPGLCVPPSFVDVYDADWIEPPSGHVAAPGTQRGR